MKTLYLYLLINCAFSTASAFEHNKNPAVNDKSVITAAIQTGENRISPLYLDNCTDTGTAAAETPADYKKPPRPLKVFDIYPNPANKFVYIRITGRQTVTLRNEEGRLIFRTAIREKATVNLTPLPAGIYFLTDEKTGATKEFKIVR